MIDEMASPLIGKEKFPEISQKQMEIEYRHRNQKNRETLASIKAVESGKIVLLGERQATYRKVKMIEKNCVLSCIMPPSLRRGERKHCNHRENHRWNGQNRCKRSAAANEYVSINGICGRKLSKIMIKIG